jgi:hypothetical protein
MLDGIDFKASGIIGKWAGNIHTLMKKRRYHLDWIRPLPVIGSTALFFRGARANEQISFSAISSSSFVGNGSPLGATPQSAFFIGQ